LDDRREPKIGLSFCRIQPQVLGRFDVTTATKDSRTAHEAASWGPVTVFCDIVSMRNLLCKLGSTYLENEYTSQDSSNHDEDGA
jgi:hypothetical protein